MSFLGSEKKPQKNKTTKQRKKSPNASNDCMKTYKCCVASEERREKRDEPVKFDFSVLAKEKERIICDNLRTNELCRRHYCTNNNPAQTDERENFKYPQASV